MKHRHLKLFPRFVTSATLAATILFVSGALIPQSARAEADQHACGDFVGTFLTTNFDSDGSVDSRSLITFWADGNFQFIDSNEGGVEGVFNPFTTATGAWTCNPKRSAQKTATMVTLDFTLPGSEGSEQQIARLDFFDVMVDPETGTIRGAATLRFFPFDGDPLDPPVNDVEPFFWEGERVMVGTPPMD